MECSICYKVYDTKNLDRYPLILECGHTLCKTCVKDLLSENPRCHLCRLKITKKIEDLKTNFALLEILNQKDPYSFLNNRLFSDIIQEQNLSQMAKIFSNFIKDKKLILKMPKITNPKVLQAFDKFGPFLEAIEDPETSDLPYEVPYQFENGAIYMGQIKNGMREVSSNGFIYEGIWRNYMYHKKGRLIHSESYFYFGEWKDGMVSGKGKSIDLEGTTYEGDWLDDKKHGFGKLTCLEGASYEGYFKNGKPDGKGKIDFADGSFFEGDFSDGYRDGVGLYKWNDGEIYEGEFKKNQMHGKGSQKLPDGSKCTGEYLNGERQGFGIIELPDGSKYQAHWIDGRIISWTKKKRVVEEKKQEWVVGKRKKMVSSCKCIIF